MTPKTEPRLAAVVLAGGRSKRFRSAVPKVLHRLAGRTLLEHVLHTLKAVHRTLPLEAVAVVVPPGGAVEDAFDLAAFPFPVTFGVQGRALGTGDAARVGLARLGAVDELLVLAGDAPLVSANSLRKMVRARRKAGAGAALLSAELDEPGAYGRVFRSADGTVDRIVEAKDLAAAERGVTEINASIYCFDRDALRRRLPRLRNQNAQGEYYLTDVVGMLVGDGRRVLAVKGQAEEILGANTRADLEALTRVVRDRVIDELFAKGVTVIDPASTYVDVGVQVGRDTVLHPHTFLEGETVVGAGCEIGPSARLVDCRVGDGATVTFSVARASRIGPAAEVGPFASIRPGTTLGRGAKAGTFVEMKSAEVGDGSKVPHLAYMGDVRIGKGTNVGAGTITCNYNPFVLSEEGSSKHRTWIGDDVYISSDTMLVAPVRLGDGSQTGAGSVVNRNVKERTLVYGVPATERGPAKERAAKGGKGSPKKRKKKVSRGRRSGGRGGGSGARKGERKGE